MIKPHNSPTRAAYYPRVSRTGKRTAEQLLKHTLAEQRGLAENFLPRGIAFVDDPRYQDLNVSGRTSERPGLQAVFEDVEAGKVDAVVVGYLSRFGRNTRELLENVERLDAAGATLYVARDGLIITPGTRGTAKMLLTLLAAVAEMQADQLEEGLARANATALENGVSIAVPYGYRREDGPGSRLVPDERDDLGPAPAEIVRRIFAQRADGVSPSAIAAELNNEHVSTPTAYEHARGDREKPGATSWKHNTILGIAATQTYRGVIPRATHTVPVMRDGEPTSRRRAVAWECLPGEHEPLVDDDTFKAANPKGERAIRNGSQGGALLQGLVRCRSCSRTMRPSKARGVLTYVCRGGADCSQPARIQPRELVDDYVIAELLEGASGRGVETVRLDRERLDALRDELATAEAELSSYVGLSSAMKPEHYLAGYQQRSERVDELGRAVSDLSRTLGAHDAQKLVDLRTKPLEDQREVLRELLDAVVITPSAGRWSGVTVDQRVELVPKGLAPFELSGSGRIIAARPWPEQMD